MPLRDHFHSPWREENHWESFHSAWVNTMVRHLNGSVLPKEFRAEPNVHLGAYIEADVATFTRNGHSHDKHPREGESTQATAVWSPPKPVQSMLVDFLDQDIYEVKVYDRARSLVAVVELVSPGNKDRPEKVKAFLSKCVTYLQQQVGFVLVDIVTNRHTNFFRKLIESLPLDKHKAAKAKIYGVAFHTFTRDEHRELDTWPAILELGKELPTLPLWLTEDLAVPLDLESSYEETCRVLRID